MLKKNENWKAPTKLRKLTTFAQHGTMALIL